MTEFNSPISHPEYEKVALETRSLQMEVTSLLTERDFLQLQKKPQLESEYLIKLGVYEYKVFEFQCNVLRIRRKIELIRAQFNCCAKVDVKEIEEQLDQEYNEFATVINGQKKELEDAIARQARWEWLKPADSEEMRSLYFTIVRKLHPDVHPNSTPEETKLLLSAIKSFEHGDLELLRVIYAALLEITPKPENVSVMEELTRLRDFLKERQMQLTIEIENINSSFPFNQRDYLSDESAIERRKAELAQLLTRYQEIYAEYEKVLQSLLGDITEDK